MLLFQAIDGTEGRYKNAEMEQGAYHTK